MLEYIKNLCVVLLLVFTCGNTEVTVENGGYSVSVSFSQNVAPGDGKVLLDNVKESLKNASDILHNATGLGFSKVVFKIPTSWNASELNVTIEQQSEFNGYKSDLLIDNTNNVVFGKFPFAQQYGGCGTPGSHITVPTAFFDEANTFPKGISLAREWLKYRYGVFDENGYSNDPLYPLYYTIPGSDPNEVKITDCTNEEITYIFLDQKDDDCSTSDKTLIERLDSGECKVIANESTEYAGTSSMMYFQEKIRTLQQVCGIDPSHNHNSRSPNKQNTLCYGQSIWDVVKKSPDFERKVDNEEYGDIQYSYIQEAKPKVVIAWENTLHIKEKGSVILSAVKQFIIDLPNGSKFAGFPFTITAKSNSLQELNSLDDKKTLMQNIAATKFLNEKKGDVNYAISAALDVFSSASSDSEVGGTIIIIAKSIRAPDETVRQRLKDSNLCIIFLLFSEDGMLGEEDITKIKRYESASSCATVKEFSTTVKNESTFRELLKVTETLLPSPEDNMATETEKIEYLTEASPISLHVGGSVETVTFFVFDQNNGENFRLRFNGEEKDNVWEEELINDVLALSYSPTEAGDIEFGYLYGSPESMLTHVRVTFKAGKHFSGEIFIRDTSEGPVQMPVIIYAVIRFGAYPVQNAKVLATIEMPNELNATFELNDDGKGDPDITQNDGVYSRYFTQFSEKGTYTVTVTVTDNDEFATFGADENTGYKSCCGSYVNGDTSKLEVFTKVLTTTFEAKSGRPDEGYKPSRISDLRIDKITDDKIILKWTAPGEEADHGTASQYDIKIFCGEDNITMCDTHKMVTVLDKPPPLNYGNEQQVTIQIVTTTEILSMGIIAVNGKNKSGELSNIIEIFRPTDKPLEVTTTAPDPSTKRALSAGTITGIVIPWILIIMCIVVAITCYFKRKSKGKTPEIYEIEENINKDNPAKSTFKATDCSIKSAPVKKIESFPVLLYTHDQLKDLKEKDTAPPLYKADIPPKTWKSLDGISNIKNGEGDRETKSLGSSSTLPATTGGSGVNVLNDVESQTK